MPEGEPATDKLLVSLVEGILSLAAALALLALAGRGNPFALLVRGARRIVLAPAYRNRFLGVLLLIAFDLIETALDGRMTAALPYDATIWIHRLEGDWARWAQAWAPLPLVALLAFFYIPVFPVVLGAPLALAAAEEDLESFRALIRGLTLNYLVCLPFYLFFPVKEMWAAGAGSARLLLDDLSPALMEAYRATSGLDNCFPSFHTSLAVTAAVIACRMGPPLFARAVALSAAGVVLSTLYLGIHWIADVAAGLALGLWAGLHQARRITAARARAGGAGGLHRSS